MKQSAKLRNILALILTLAFMVGVLCHSAVFAVETNGAEESVSVVEEQNETPEETDPAHPSEESGLDSEEVRAGDLVLPGDQEEPEETESETTDVEEPEQTEPTEETAVSSGGEPEAAESETEESGSEQTESEAEAGETEASDPEAGTESVLFEAETDALTVSVEAEDGTFPQGAKLTATDLSKEDAVQALEQSDKSGSAVRDAVGVDLTFSHEGEEVQPADGKSVSVTLKLKTPLEKAETESVLVLHEHGEDEAEPTAIDDAKVSGSTVRFDTENFSKFYVGTLANPGDAASLDGTLYATLQEAVNAAGENDTIVIVSDLTLTATVNIPAGKHITLTDDGTARTIEGNGTNATAPLLSAAKGGTLTLAATADENLTLVGGSVRGDRVTVVRSSGTLNIESVTIEGGTLDGNSTAAVFAASGSKMNMSGGIIENTTGSADFGGAVYVDAGVEFNLSGGSIRNNSNSSTDNFAAGGLMVSNWNSTNPETKVTMTGGSITGNSGGNGGGVCMAGRATFHLIDGEISNNTAARQGGGVCVTGFDSRLDAYATNSFIMDGGHVDNNTAMNGGGIYVNSDAVYLNAGYIEGNTARAISYNQWSGHGGGVYVSAVPRVLHVNDAIITENTAVAAAGFGGTSGMGGGLWACPTGSIDLKVTNGVAVYNNHAEGRDTAGDDVVKVHRDAGTQGTLTLADRMLGGGAVEWYQDGGIIGSTVGYADSDVPRYDPENPGEPMHFDHDTENVALKAVVSEEAIRRAEAEAKLYIRYNTGNHGGGIGTNGDLTLANYDIPDWDLSVTKKWQGVPEDQRTAVTVYLKIGDSVLDPITLSAENDWSGEFTQLPDPRTLSTQDITVVEGSMVTGEDGTATFQETTRYTVDYDTVVDNEEITIFSTVTNSPSAETIEIPVEKVWVDENNAGGKRPDSVTVTLLADGEAAQEGSLTEANDWKHTFADLRKFDAADGHEIEYTLSETAVDGYTSAISGTAETGFTVTNTIAGKVSVPVTKVWKGTPQTGVTVRLLADGEEADSHTLTADSGWQYTFSGLEQYRDGKEITYTVTEDPVEGYTSEITGDQNSGFVVTNTEEEEPPTPSEPEEPTPSEPEEPTPSEPEEPTPSEPEEPTPSEPEEPTPSEPETPTPGNPEPPAPNQPDKPAETPNTGDSSLILTVSIFSAAAASVAAVTAWILIRKRSRKDR